MCRHLGLHKAELSVLLVNDRRMRELNRAFRGVDRTTDVLSFPQTDNPPLPPFRKGGRGGITHKLQAKFRNPQSVVLGDIVVNLRKTERQALEYGHSFYGELHRLLIHGLLHLVGYDHEKKGNAGRKMRRKERELQEILR